MLTKEQIAAMQGRYESIATFGSWRCEQLKDGNWVVVGPADENGISHIIAQCSAWKNKADFIAGARQDIPALLDALDEAEWRTAALEQVVKHHSYCVNFIACCTFNPPYGTDVCDKWQFDYERFAAGKEDE